MQFFKRWNSLALWCSDAGRLQNQLEGWSNKITAPGQSLVQQVWDKARECMLLVRGPHWDLLDENIGRRGEAFRRKRVYCQRLRHELPDVQAGFRKGRATRDQMATSAGSLKKQESSRKTSISALLTMPKPLTVWITINRGKFWKRWEYQPTWPASWETYMQVRKQQLELDMKQQTGSK